MKLLIEMLWIFSVFSFLGWVVKFIVYSIKRHRPVNPGFLVLPFLPSNGVGMLLVFLMFSRLDNHFIVFFGSAVALTVYRFFTVDDIRAFFRL